SLQRQYDNLEQTIRVVDEAESRMLNQKFREIDASTNVLSFSTDSEYLDYQCLGDLVICAPVVAAEAEQQGKAPLAHWAHMVVHGMLHLQGLGHQTEAEAKKMEALEVKILSTLGYINPYNS
ncbi:MAG: rRNA maturation RNase YbeY, partial [Gammaproteobacteria bacterium]